MRIYGEETRGGGGGTTPVVASVKTEQAEHLWTTNNRLTAAFAQTRCAEQRYRAVFENAADLISILTPEGVIVEVNQRSQDVLGISPDQMIGCHVSDFAIPGEEETFNANYRESVDKVQHRRVVPMRRPDGTVRQIEFSTNLIELDGHARLLSVGRDVTENRRLEESLRQSQKMEALGQLTGGIAHDFNNILTIIVANSHLLLDDFGQSDPRREDVEQIRIAAERAAGLTRQLLAFSRRQVLEPTIVDLNVTVGDLEKMLQRLIGEDIELSFIPGSELGAVLADVGQIEQVVMNLVVNARDAMPNGGKLSIETSNVELDEDDLAHHAEPSPGRYVMLAISDNGSGMDDETKRRLFEPFFTTKPRGKGTGLGLSTCYGIARQSGGTILVHSEVGRGTVFKVYLPRVDGRPEPVRPQQTATSELDGTETILLVEDDERVRTSIGRILSVYGYRVLNARHGNEAIAVAKRRDARIHLVLSDVVIPGLSGPDAVNEVRKLWPEAKVLFMSGYTDHAIFRDGGLRAGMSFIQKPFAPKALARKIRTILDASCLDAS
jgi:two-component system, cell cycle sensor histidine kinase and response regulator CckA